MTRFYASLLALPQLWGFPSVFSGYFLMVLLGSSLIGQTSYGQCTTFSISATVSSPNGTTATWAAPATGGPYKIRITAKGAKGGNSGYGTRGGGGATITGEFSVTAGQVLELIAGAPGGNGGSGGGGGGSAVRFQNGALLVVAGGGGGGGGGAYDANGSGGNSVPTGTSAIGGGGGGGGVFSGGGGVSDFNGSGGVGAAGGGTGGGGAGGGGGGGANGGASGGGYSGGAAGGFGNNGGGSGGGSFNAGINQVNSAGANAAGGEVTIELRPTRLYVRASAPASDQTGLDWDHAFTTLEAALSYPCSASLSEIWVASGLYAPATTLSMKNGVGIYGSFTGSETSRTSRVLSYPLSTTLSGGGVRQVFTNSDLDNTALLDGFVLANGKAEFGGAMSNIRSSPTLTNCSFQANSATNSGGAMYNNGSNGGNSSPTLTNCAFINNSASSQGGAIFNKGNNGGNSSPKLTNCAFINNSADFGGAMYNDGNFNGNSSPTLTNSSFLNNSATTVGRAIYNNSPGGISSPILTNCVLFGNAGSSAIFGSNVLASYSLFENGVTGFTDNGNNITGVTTSPFASTASVALVTCSPAINAGLTSANSTTVDLAGQPRLVGSRIDMGAVEYQGSTTLAVGITPNPSLTIGVGQSVTLTASGADSYRWSAGVSTTTISVSVAGPYSVTGTTGSCSGTATVSVTTATPACGTVVYVTQAGAGLQDGSSWTNAFSGTALQTAINTAAGCGAQVWVAQGTYKPTTSTNRAISFAMKNGVAIYGGLAGTEPPGYNMASRDLVANRTTLSGDLGTQGNTGDNSYHIISNPAGLTSTAILDGFVITGGNANGNNTDGYGGGIYNNGSGSGNFCNPQIRHCSFVANSAGSGGAMYNYGVQGNSSPSLINCSFQNNQALGGSTNDGGAMYNDGRGYSTPGPGVGTSSPSLTNCTFLSNSASRYGGAMYNDGSGYGGTSSPSLTNCTFQANFASNTGGAMFNFGYSYGTSSPRLTNCTFQANTASINGGAMYSESAFSGTSSPSLTNCAFQNNTAPTGGAMANSSSRSTISLTNCVLFGNGGNNTFYNAGGTVTATYSLFDNTVTGYNSDPTNLTTTTSPFTSTSSTELRAGSPAIDAGSNSAYTTANGPATDLAGNPRFYPSNGRIDMGAYEFQGNASLSLVTSATPNPVCAGSTVALSVTASGGTAPYSYTWAAPAGITLSATSTSAVSASVSAGLSGPQTFTITVAASGGSPTSTSLVSLTVNALPTISIAANPSLTVTQGQSATLTASGANSYSWSNGQSTSAISVSVAGPYSVTGTIGSCASVTTVTLTVNAPVCGAGLSGPIWTGCVSRDWNTAGNWASGTVPAATDDVVIPSGPTNQPILSTPATAKSVEVQSGASLSITAVGSLAINSFATLGGFPGAFYNQGTVNNNGTLMLGNTAPVGLIGLHNIGTFTNTGTLQVDRATNQGINNRDRATFTNTGNIIIGASVPMGTQGIWNQATFIHTGGTITIDRITGDGLLNSGNFVNSATITIGASASVTGNGLTNNPGASFTNATGGTITIDRTGVYGLANTFTATFINSSTITIGSLGTIGNYGIVNPGLFTNSACATLTLLAPIFNNSNSFTNAGLLTVNTTRTHIDNGTLTNYGIIDYPQGNPIPNVVNNDVIVASISSPTQIFSPALQLGGSSGQFTVGTTWYSDPDLTQPAGTYNQGTNTFTATSLATGSTTTLYFAATDNTAGCTRTVAISLMVVTPCGAVVYVTPTGAGAQNGSSWTNAFPGTALQTAINTAAGCNAQVWVAAGTYKPTTTTGPNSRTISFSMANGVAIYGGLTGTEPPGYNMDSRDLTANKTTLSGDIDGVVDVVTGSGSTLSITGNDGNAYHVINNNNNGLTSSAILDGFTISGGNASLLGTDANNGGGMYNSLVSPTIRNCMFYANSAVFSGGAMYTSSTINMTNCRFLNNKADVGGAIQTQARLSGVTVNHTLLNCSFTGNVGTTTAGAINHGFGNSQGQGLFDCTNCTFTNNYAFNGSDLGSAGAFFNEAVGFDARFTNCLFDGNKGLGTQADEGGGALLVYSGTVTVLNSTFVNNGAATKGGAIRIYQGQGTVNVKNSVFRSNTAPIDADISTEAGGVFTIQNSLLQVAACPPNVTCGPGMIYNQDPLFVNPGADNYQLTACSPAIDAGDPATTSATAGNTDLAGNSRFYTGGPVDMGAYEFQGTANQPIGITSQPVAGSMACAGSTVTATVSVSGTAGTPGGPYTYQWYKAGSAVSNQTSATLTLTNVRNSNAGSYSVVITGACNSVTSTAFNLTINPAVTATITGTLTVITGGTTTLTASDAASTGTSFTWSTGQTTASVSVTAGVYSVTVANASGCTGTANATVVTVNSPPVAVANANQNAMLGVYFTYTVNAFTDIDTPNSLTYSASIVPANSLTFDPNTRVISGFPTQSGAATVTITATDPGGLSASTSFTITVAESRLTVWQRDPDNNQPSPNTIKPYLELQNDGSSPIPYSELTVRYYLTLENPAPLQFQINYAQLGSDKVHLTYVPLNPARQGATGYIEYSFDGSAGSLGAMSNSGPIQNSVNKQDYSAFNQGDDYSYMNNGNFTPNPRITAYRNGVLIYGVEPGPLTGGNTPLSLMASASPTTILTTGSTTLSATASGGMGPYSYSFTGPGTITPNGNTASVSNLPAGVQTFTVRVSDASQPTSQSISTMVSVTVTSPAPNNTPPTPTANNNQTATVGVAFSYQVNAFTDAETPNSLTYSASIAPANGFTFNPATRVIQGQPISAGVSSVTITATDPGGLSASTVFTITVSPAVVTPTALSLTASASPTMILTTGSTTLSATVSGGTQPYSYVFTGPGTITPNGNTASVSNLPAGVQTFTVKVSDASQPTSQSISTMVSVTVSSPAPNNTPPTATANNNQTATVGVGFAYTVNAFGDAETPGSLTYSASISPTNGLSFDPATRVISGTPTAAGVSNVVVTATDPGGLSASTSFSITVSPAPVSGTTQLTVLQRDPDNNQPSPNTIKPYLELQNDGSSPIPYSELTVRYYLTLENPAPLQFQINYAQLGSDKVHLTYVPLNPARQGATGYIEYSFDGSAGSLGAMSNSGPIQNSVNKQDYSAFNQGDDYSYMNNGNFTPNPRITAYRNGVLVYGVEPPAGVRLGAEGADEPLEVRVLGNPVTGSEVAVEVRGGSGQPLRLRVTDLSGHLVSEQTVERAGAVEHQRLPVSEQPAGLLFIQVSTPTQTKTIKVLKAE